MAGVGEFIALLGMDTGRTFCGSVPGAKGTQGDAPFKAGSSGGGEVAGSALKENALCIVWIWYSGELLSDASSSN